MPPADARKLMNNDLIRPLLQVHQAFNNEELGSSQWLRMRPEYGIKLKETLEKFMFNIDREHFETLDKDVQKRLEQFGPTQSQQEKTSHCHGGELRGGWLSKFLLLLKMNEKRGISLNRVCARWELPISLSLRRQLPPQRTRRALALVGLILSFNFFIYYLIIQSGIIC
ncbi:hypothetical protein EV421DRAFT_1372796 [Armillaria borealis]|uniref:Uncharacterized protein n=1 Tax=Armillaria borealis TaxID=47425 RepID=A0AA39J1Z5_9AGAR|nr:hypothetical protein EV421DRAFT_1372796 [Armillaria borealis]